MCGRYVSPTQAEMERYWAYSGRGNQLGYIQHGNIAPTTQIPIIYPGDDGLEMCLGRWGLVPFWWKKPKMPPFTFNARIEEASAKPMWRQVVKTSRCLIPAIGWYEWKEMEITDPITGEIKMGKQPFFIHLNEKRQVFPFAGVMSWWKIAEMEGMMLTAAVITRPAEGVAAEVHARMPIVLPKEAEAAWLDRAQIDGKKALEQAHTTSITELQYHAVSTRVNSVRNTGVDLIEPFPNPA